MASDVESATDRARPAPVNAAFFLLLANIALGLAAGAVALLGGDPAVRSVDGTLLGVASGIWIVVLLVETGLAFAMRGGANWARIVLTALTALQAGGVAMEAVRGNLLTGSGLAGLLALALTATAVVLMFRPESSRYFARK
ncbi:hypothetical protein [Allonocardiopsis opalescens]|uniref:Uncharacterized protein n=1 Tax=Allonocardiopsis opalescens TaxID=1144618 RepID=A0A2T0Q4G9_9ACTN|nr:hypothetical protein [Allonocardiopsis opalescens]PRX98680.1 hypothetical protein CLV72_104259 [Allonocardiopsis opalescens]